MGKLRQKAGVLRHLQNHFWQIDERETRSDRGTQEAQALWFSHSFETLQVGDVYPILLLDPQGGVGGQVGSHALVGFLDLLPKLL